MDKGYLKISRFLTVIFASYLLFGCAPPPIQERSELVFPAPPDPARFIFEKMIYSNLDIEGESEDEAMTRFLTGIGKQGQGFSKPFDVAVHQGRIFVSDTASRKVYLIDKSKGLFKTIGDDSPEPFSKPMGLDVDENGNLYVMDITAKTLSIFDRDGSYLKSIKREELFSRPTGVAVDPKGTTAYVIDVGGVQSDKHQIQVFDIASGEHLRTMSKRGKGPGDLNLPKDAVIGKDGRLYVVDSGNFRINAYNPDGTFSHSFGQIGLQYGDFSRPKGISVDPDGNIYVVDAGFGNFQIFTPDGTLLLFVGNRSSRGDRAEYMLPAGIDVDEDGRVYVVDQYHRKLEVYRPVALKETDGYFGKPKPEVKK
ncbi:MAG: hypothetical protein V7739_20405 [Motiliproteus sp.]